MATQSSSLIGTIYGIENPLLDITSIVTEEFLNKYNLKVNTACLASEEHLPLFDTIIADPNVEYIAGGATQNSMRVCQWMLQIPNSTYFTGCVGNDNNGKILANCAAKDGLNTYYLIDENTPTGTCAVLVHNKDRCLVANLAAANNYKIEHLLKDEIQAVWKNSKFYYSSGFFLTVSVPSALTIAQHAYETGKVYMTNLSAPFICQFFKDAVLSVLPYVDYLFGNESECKAFGEAMQYEDLSLEAIALKIASFEKKSSKPRCVVITQGKDSTLVVYNGQIAHFTVPLVPKEKIVDLNGAGDAFVGGFISQLALGKNIFDCVRAGHYAAGYIIQVSGIQVSGKPDFN